MVITAKRSCRSWRLGQGDFLAAKQTVGAGSALPPASPEVSVHPFTYAGDCSTIPRHDQTPRRIKIQELLDHRDTIQPAQTQDTRSTNKMALLPESRH